MIMFYIFDDSHTFTKVKRLPKFYSYKVISDKNFFNLIIYIKY